MDQPSMTILIWDDELSDACTNFGLISSTGPSRRYAARCDSCFANVLKPLAALALSSLTACATAAAGAWTLPNASTTPGAIGSSDPAVVCAYGYASAHRDVPYSVRDRVYDEYGIPRGHRKGLRIDHLIPLETGGSNDERNLWPQPLAESRVKDRVEDDLRVAVCVRHTLTLADAQAAISRNWTTTPVGLPAVRTHHYAEDEQ